MSIDWRNFKRDPHFFLKYFFTQMVTSLALFVGLHQVRAPFAEGLQVTVWHLPLILASIVLGVMIPSLLHNAVHFNLRRRWLNEVVGELGGFFVLFGLGPFRISHFLHHAFADSERDPHPPRGKRFLPFLLTTQMETIKVIRKAYLDMHGDDRRTQTILFVEMGFYYVSMIARLACWLWLLGPTLFVCFYLPAYLTNLVVFAHINFATHQTQDDGSVAIVNLNHNAYYKVVNLVGSGVYFHKNHHLKPSAFNPGAAHIG